jgi:hypothetical protein
MQKQVIEFAGMPVGIAIPVEDKLQFLAVKFHVIGLDGQTFRTLTEIRNALRMHLDGKQAAA